MHQDIPKAELEARWERTPLPANLDELDLIMILKIMERLELAYQDRERKLKGLNRSNPRRKMVNVVGSMFLSRIPSASVRGGAQGDRQAE